MPDVIGAVRGHAAINPSAPAVDDGNERLSYSQLIERVDAFAQELAASGARTIALAADNGIPWIVCDLAARVAGVALVPLPPFFSAEQIRHVITDGGVEQIVFDRAGGALLDSMLTGPRFDMQCGLSRVACGRVPESQLFDGAARLSYTSGTTGAPKGVELSGTAMDHVAESLAAVGHSLAVTRHVCLLPFAVLLENIGGVYAPLMSGACVMCPSMFATGVAMSGQIDGERILHTLVQGRAESAIVLPQLLAAMVEALERGCALPALRFLAVGGARTPESLLLRARELGLPVYEGYGLTECASVVALNTPAADRPVSVGKPLPHARVRIADDGEIVVAGAVFDGYRGRARNADGEVFTGDIGYVDDDGYLYVEGRKDNVFVTSFGRNLSPEWIESRLSESSAICQAVVVGANRPWNAAIVVPGSNSTTATEISAAIEDTNLALPEYARITRWIIAENRFDVGNGLLTPNGRYRRDAITALFAERISECYAQ